MLNDLEQCFKPIQQLKTQYGGKTTDFLWSLEVDM